MVHSEGLLSISACDLVCVLRCINSQKSASKALCIVHTESELTFENFCLSAEIAEASAASSQDGGGVGRRGAWRSAKEQQLWVYAQNNPGVSGLDTIRDAPAPLAQVILFPKSARIYSVDRIQGLHV